MYRILSCSKDTYITNKIINNKFRATDANVGKAGTLDLFKLYDESTSGSDSAPTELTRALLKFDLKPLRRLLNSTLDISSPTFKCYLKLHDVYGGQTTPSNFKLIVFPLARSFDEGIGRDIVRFSDIDSSNWVTASVSSGVVDGWNIHGARNSGSLGEANIDVIVSGTISKPAGPTAVSLSPEQTFLEGTEDLNVDITTIISGVLSNQISDNGFLVAYSGSYEIDKKSYFVKRFASRHSSNPSIRPKIIVKYDDSLQDHHRDFFFNISGSLFLNNFHRGVPANILSSSEGRLYGVSGSNCLVLRIESGSSDAGTFFTKSITGSQHSVGNNFITGVYSASFAISEFESTALRNEIIKAHSATFREYWGSTDYTVGYYTGSFVVNVNSRTALDSSPGRLFVNITNIESRYLKTDKVKFRVFVEDISRPIKFKRLPLETKSQIFTQMYYRVRDFENGNIVIPFETNTNATLLSTDTDGMYFEFYMDSIPPGRTHVFDFLIKDKGFDQIFTEVAAKFSVE